MFTDMKIYSWFDHNYHKVVRAFKKLEKVQLRDEKIKQLEEQIEILQKINATEWEEYRVMCIQNKEIP